MAKPKRRLQWFIKRGNLFEYNNDKFIQSIISIPGATDGNTKTDKFTEIQEKLNGIIN